MKGFANGNTALQTGAIAKMKLNFRPGRFCISPLPAIQLFLWAVGQYENN
jgi:hypothetical protein